MMIAYAVETAILSCEGIGMIIIMGLWKESSYIDG